MRSITVTQTSRNRKCYLKLESQRQRRSKRNENKVEGGLPRIISSHFVFAQTLHKQFRCSESKCISFVERTLIFDRKSFAEVGGPVGVFGRSVFRNLWRGTQVQGMHPSYQDGRAMRDARAIRMRDMHVARALSCRDECPSLLPSLFRES